MSPRSVSSTDRAWTVDERDEHDGNHHDDERRWTRAFVSFRDATKESRVLRGNRSVSRGASRRFPAREDVRTKRRKNGEENGERRGRRGGEGKKRGERAGEGEAVVGGGRSAVDGG